MIGNQTIVNKVKSRLTFQKVVLYAKGIATMSKGSNSKMRVLMFKGKLKYSYEFGGIHNDNFQST